MAVPAKSFYTPEEYLALEDKSDQRHEYYAGEIYAMSGASLNHNQIAGNAYLALRQQLSAKLCRVFITDMRLLVKKRGLYTYPDVMVVCGNPELVPGRTDTLTNPILIVEVLSESTREYDRTKKFASYRQITTLQEYVLIAQEQVFVEIFRRTESNLWVYEAYDRLDSMVKLNSLGIEIPVSSIYERVEFPGVRGEQGTSAAE